MTSKLAAIYNVYDGEELLIGSMRSVKDGVDLFIIMYQTISNFGEEYDPLAHLPVEEMKKEFNVMFVHHDYNPEYPGMVAEAMKRNRGLKIARANGCTHFISMDCDEYYLPGDFVKGKRLYFESKCEGSVVSIFTYFKNPELRQSVRDGYYVPFIHIIDDCTRLATGEYPYYVDPTRKVNTLSVAQLPVDMQHYSWVRKDIDRKARNSSARENIRNSSLMSDYATAQEGSKVNGGFTLIKVPDYFGINEMLSTFGRV